MQHLKSLFIFAIIAAGLFACSSKYKAGDGEEEGDTVEEDTVGDDIDGREDVRPDVPEGEEDAPPETPDGVDVPEDETEVEAPECEDASECLDDNICNGSEDCVGGSCQPGTDLDDGSVCAESPRSICRSGACELSTCGDGFVDGGAGESCEPPGEGACDAACHLECTSGADCPDDGDICNGEEYCDTSVNRCDRRNPPGDGTACGTAPKRICRAGTCQDSVCGDGLTDPDVGEECDDANGTDGDGCDDCRYSCHNATECDDSLPCSQDACDAAGSHTCSHTAYVPADPCRPSAGVCDDPEVCDGVSLDCPADAFNTGRICRDAADDCDVEEACDGSSVACPTDAKRPDGYACEDGLFCTVTDTCQSGVCQGGVPNACLDADACTIDSCDDAGNTCNHANARYLEVGAGTEYTCGTIHTGEIRCWGHNDLGQLGDGTTTNRTQFITVSGISSGAGMVSAAHGHTCAVVSGGVKCWGSNGNGQLGNGTTTSSSVPVDVTGLPGTAYAVTVGGGSSVGGDHSCAIVGVNRNVMCWGDNAYGQLGNDTTTDSSTPVYAHNNVGNNLSNIQQVSAGARHTCALTSSNRVLCWGENYRGQLGDGNGGTMGDISDHAVVVDIAGVYTATMVSAGLLHTCAVIDGGVKCWGYGRFGRLGNNDPAEVTQLSPVDVSGMTAGAGATLVAAGNGHTCALDTTPTPQIYCWGLNADGQLGQNPASLAQSIVPVAVPGLSGMNATRLDADDNHSCIVLGGGSMICWGGNDFGQLGTGATGDVWGPQNDVCHP
jgi:alpha-tubulin suppressor-like RCC1 family protein